MKSPICFRTQIKTEAKLNKKLRYLIQYQIYVMSRYVKYVYIDTTEIDAPSRSCKSCTVRVPYTKVPNVNTRESPSRDLIWDLRHSKWRNPLPLSTNIFTCNKNQKETEIDILPLEVRYSWIIVRRQISIPKSGIEPAIRIRET